MKKLLLASAVSAAVAMPGVALAQHHSHNTNQNHIYGKVNVSVDRTEFPAVSDNWQINSNKSFFGLRGHADLDFAGLRGIYQLELGINPTRNPTMTNTVGENRGSAGNTLTTRNSFVGLQSNLGTVKAGTFDTPLRELGRRVDQFNDLQFADIFNLVAGEWRAEQIVQYSTPQIADLVTVNIATVASDRDDVNDTTRDNTGLFDSYSVSALLEHNNFYAGIGFDHNNFGATGQNGTYLSNTFTANTLTDPASLDIVRAVAGIDLDLIELGVMLQQAETRQRQADLNDRKEKEQSFLVSGAVPLGLITLKAQYGETDTDIASNAKVRHYTVGADYALGQQTHTYIYGTQRSTDGDRDYGVVGIGAEHRF